MFWSEAALPQIKPQFIPNLFLIYISMSKFIWFDDATNIQKHLTI